MSTWASVTQSAEEWALDVAEVKRVAALATRPHAKRALDALAVDAERHMIVARDAEARAAKAAAASATADKAAGDAGTATAAAAAGDADGDTGASDASVGGGGGGGGGASATAKAVAPPRPPAAAADPHSYKGLDSFAWDQSDKFVTVYVSGLEGVGKAHKAAQKGEGGASVDCAFTKTSFDLRVVGLSGANYRLVQTPLSHEIEPSGSKFKVKDNKVVVMLRKHAEGSGGYSYPPHWTELRSKTGKTKKEPKFDDKSDPSAGIMDLMKNLYDEGDDQMKRTIAEAWTKSRSGAAGGGADDPMGM